MEEVAKYLIPTFNRTNYGIETMKQPSKFIFYDLLLIAPIVELKLKLKSH